MEPEFEQKYHDVEASHWWFKSRRLCILTWLKNAPRDSQILDIGCSSGLMLLELQQVGFSQEGLHGVDISAVAIAKAKQNGALHVSVQDATSISFNKQFDYIIASDCLEHINHDEAALENWLTLLKPGGSAFIFVPAFMALWSPHDLANRHYRRYTKKQLINKLCAAGFTIKRAGYWNFFLFIPVFCYRIISKLWAEKRQSHGDISQSPVFVNTLLTSLLQVENRLLNKITFPFGVSTFCIAKK